MKKRLASLFLALVLCLGLCLPALAFTDVPGDHYAYAAIMDCSERGVVGGYSDGTFQPGKTVSKNHFCAMLARAFYPDQIAKHDTDFVRQECGTFGPTTQTLLSNKILRGTSFQYSSSDTSIMGVGINRYDMAQMMANILTRRGFSVSESEQAAAAAKITDYGNVPEQYRAAVASVYALGMIGGFSDGAFHGDGVMNRGQAAVVIYRMMQQMQGDTGNQNTPESKPVETPETKPEPEPEPEPKPERPETKPVETPEVSETPEIVEKPAGKTLTNGKAITESNIEEMLNELKAKYPEGTNFVNGYAAGANSSDVRTPVRSYTGAKNHTRNISTEYGCGGWAALVSDYIFGQTGFSARKIALADARPGDIAITLDGNGELRHVAIVTSRAWHDDYSESTQINTTDANPDSTGAYSIYWTNGNAQWDVLQPGDHTLEVWTRYPD